MIKRIYYYFELKMLLKMKDLIPFVEFVLRHRYGGISLFCYCMKRKKSILHWMEWLCSQDALHHLADMFTFPDASLRTRIIKNYNSARDFWGKNVKR